MCFFAGHKLSVASPLAIPLGPTPHEGPASMPLLEGRSNIISKQPVHSYIPGQAAGDCNVHGSGCRDQEQQGPAPLQQAIADAVQTAAFDAGSSDNLAVVVLDIRPTAHVRPWANAAADSATIQQADVAGAAWTAATEACISPLEAPRKHGASAASPADSATDLSWSGHQDEHALPAELTSAFESEIAHAPEGSCGLLCDSSQLPLGHVFGQTDTGSSQYRLVQQLAQLPRYADHVHTSWIGLPVLSTMSLWLQPCLSHSATSSRLTTQHPRAEGICSDVSWLANDELADLTASSSSQVMLSPGTMLQPASWGLMNPWDSSSWLPEAADHEAGTASPGSTDWLTSTAHALAEITSGMYNEGSFPAQAFPDDVFSQLPAGQASTTNLPSVEGLHGTRSDWKHDQKQQWHKYHRSRNFARGSFGEVWHAEKIFVGKQTAFSRNVCAMFITLLSNHRQFIWTGCHRQLPFAISQHAFMEMLLLEIIWHEFLWEATLTHQLIELTCLVRLVLQ